MGLQQTLKQLASDSSGGGVQLYVAQVSEVHIGNRGLFSSWFSSTGRVTLRIYSPDGAYQDAEDVLVNFPARNAIGGWSLDVGDWVVVSMLGASRYATDSAIIIAKLPPQDMRNTTPPDQPAPPDSTAPPRDQTPVATQQSGNAGLPIPLTAAQAAVVLGQAPAANYGRGRSIPGRTTIVANKDGSFMFNGKLLRPETPEYLAAVRDSVDLRAPTAELQSGSIFSDGEWYTPGGTGDFNTPSGAPPQQQGRGPNLTQTGVGRSSTLIRGLSGIRWFWQ